MDDNRKKALAAALGQIEKQFGKGSVMRLGDASTPRDMPVISTGSLGLDIALGVGGLPRGRVVEIRCGQMFSLGVNAMTSTDRIGASTTAAIRPLPVKPAGARCTSSSMPSASNGSTSIPTISR